MNNMKKAEIIKTVVVLFLFSSFMIVLCSFTTTFLNPYLLWDDSAYFQVIGKMWSKGIVPYRDVFDHKGPLLYFINAVAHSTNQPRIILPAIQTVFMFISMFSAYYLFEKYVSIYKRRLLVIYFLFYLTILGCGNMTEEYSVPFIMIAFCFEIPWIIDNMDNHRKDVKHPQYIALIDGLCIGIIGMLIIKNALPIVLVDIAIIVYLVILKQWNNLFNNLICGMLGVIIAVSPFVVYFILNNAFEDLFYDMILFNVEYMRSSASVNQDISLKILYFLIPEFLMILAAIKCILSRNYIIGGVAVWISATLSIFLLGGYRFKHYFIIGIPLMVVAFILIFTNNQNYIVVNAVCIMICGLIIITSVFRLKSFIKAYTKEGISMSEDYQHKLDTIFIPVPENERDSIVFYNLLLDDLSICLRDDVNILFNTPFMTEMYNEYDSSINKQFISFCLNKHVEWIIIDGSSSDETVMAFLKENYVEKTGLKRRYCFRCGNITQS